MYIINAESQKLKAYRKGNKTFSVKLYAFSLTACKILWWFCQGCSPLPIPNREVKPLMADGTGIPTGRVGSCHIYLNQASVLLLRLFYVRNLLIPTFYLQDFITQLPQGLLSFPNNFSNVLCH